MADDDRGLAVADLSPFRRTLFMFSLIVAGEAVFVLPYYVTRFFRPTFLEVFGFTNFDIGKAQATYGVVAVLAYFAGGPLADRFAARNLLSLSLLLTAAGGVYMSTIPSVTGMAVLWGFWGFTSILLLWAALIRATREWGGPDGQGRAYGILDGGRGMAGGVMGAAAAHALALALPADAASASLAEQTVALKNVIYIFSGSTLLAAVFVWFGIPPIRPERAGRQTPGSFAEHLRTTFRIPAIWLQSGIVITAYVAYKATDNFGLFARDAYGLDEVSSNWIKQVMLGGRVFAPLLAGLLADRFLSSRVIAGGFVLLMVGFGSLAALPATAGVLVMLAAQLVIACLAVYGLRGVYFALFEQAKVPTAVTGTAVGIVSVIGYTPDIFVGLIQGYLLDTYDGLQGHRYFWTFVAAVAVLGFVCTAAFTRVVRPKPRPGSSPSRQDSELS